MALKIRLKQLGRRNRPFYRLIVTDVRSPRDGKSIEIIGWYDPMEKADDKSVSIKADRVQHWLGSGAELSESAEALVLKAAPEVVKAHHAQLAARRRKEGEKRRARRRAKAAA